MKRIIEKENQTVNKISYRTITRIMAVMICVLCLFFAFVYFCLGNPYYEAGDDAAMNFIAAGAYGENNRTHLVFENVVYGWILFLLYEIFPGINVYLALFLILDVAAVFGICYLTSLGILKNYIWEKLFLGVKSIFQILLNLSFPILFTVIFNFLVGRELYEAIQWTKNAGLYTATGILILYFWRKNKCSLRNIWWVAGLLFMLMGYCIRRDSFLAVAGVAVCGFGTEIVYSSIIRFRGIVRSREKDHIKELVLKNKNILITFFVLFIFLSGTECANRIAYSSADWKFYKEYNSYRAILSDRGGPPDYDSNKEAYEALGIDKTDLTMFNNWAYNDPEKFSLDVLKAVVRLKGSSPRSLFSIQTLRDVAHEIKEDLRDREILIILFLFLPFLILSRNWRKWLVFCVLCMGICFEYVYFVQIERSVWRVRFLPWIGAIVCFAGYMSWNASLKNTSFEFLCKGNSIRKITAQKTINILALVISFTLLIIHTFGYVHNFNNQKQDIYPNEMTAYQEMNEMKNNLFLVDTLSFNLTKDIRSIDRRCNNLMENILSIGGWTVPSPLYREIMEKHSITNPIKQLSEKEDYYFVGRRSFIETLRAYLEKEIHKPIRVIEEKNTLITGYDVWKFVIAQ